MSHYSGKAPQVRKTLNSYLVAIGIVSFCTVISIVTRPISQRAPFLLFFPCVLFVLWYSGLRPAVLATVLSALAVDYFVTPPLYVFSTSWNEALPQLVFVVVLVAASWWIDRDRRRRESFVRTQHKLLELATQSNFTTDSQHRILRWQKGAERMYGWTQDEARGEDASHLLQTVHPDLSDARATVDAELKRDGRWKGRLLRCHKDGSQLIVESSWAMDAQTGSILQCDIDVTDRARATEELRCLNFALRAINAVQAALANAPNEDAAYQAIVKCMAEEGNYDLVWVGSREDDPARSVRVRASCGAAVELLSRTTLSWDEQHPLGRGPLSRVLRGESVCVVPDMHRPNGVTAWMELADAYGLRSAIALPLRFEGETQAALAVYSRQVHAYSESEVALLTKLADDISRGLQAIVHRRQAEAEHAQRLSLEAQLLQAQKLESLGRLAGGVAHDFNNLLMVISAQTEMLTLELHDEPLKRTREILRSAQRAAELTGQLLAFSRKQIYQPKVTTMDVILRGFGEMVSRLVGENIEVTLSLAETPWPIKVDRSQIEQIIMNLAVNSRDAMPRGGKLTLEAANCELGDEYRQSHPLVEPGKYVMLAVTDTGEGMDEATKANMFEPFFTTKEAGKGTGLGLAMVYGIVKQNGGFIWVYSEPGQGTCFKIYLPVSAVDMPQLDAVAAAPYVPAATGYSILVVEDEHPIRLVISEFLALEGHRVLSAESCAEALELVRAHPDGFDILLTDVILKDCSGRDLADAVLALGGRTRVIFMSGYTANAIVHHGVLEENTMFLQKPFSRAGLLAKVQECMAAPKAAN